MAKKTQDIQNKSKFCLKNMFNLVFTLSFFVFVSQIKPVMANDHGAHTANNHDKSHVDKHDTAHKSNPVAKTDEHHATDHKVSTDSHKTSHHEEHSSHGVKNEASHSMAKTSWKDRLKINWSPKWMNTIFSSFFHKLEDMKNLDIDNIRLKKRVAELELQFASSQSGMAECKEVLRAEHAQKKALDEGGSIRARTLASIRAANQELLKKPVREILDESLSAFNHKNFEKSALGLAHLVDLESNDEFRTSANLYMTGISFFNVHNFKKAAHYLERAAEASVSDNLSYEVRSWSWLVLAFEKAGNKSEAEKVKNKLIEKYPKSKEAKRWMKHG